MHRFPNEELCRFRRALLDRPGILQMPGTHNGMAALQARNAGFEALYLSGAGMSASMGLPDLGVITVDEVCFFVRQVARASGLPVLVDGDTGYGEALNVMHMVRAFEEAGAGAGSRDDAHPGGDSIRRSGISGRRGLGHEPVQRDDFARRGKFSARKSG